MKGLGAGRSLSPARMAALALAALALALRLYHLQFQSLWWDEGISLYLAGLDLASLTTHKDFGIDLHPPLYHLLLAGWSRLAGSSVLSARYLSAAAGALAVPVVYYLGRRTFGPASGLLAALLLATSPFHVFYSQEARMYSLMPLLGLLSAALAFRILDRRGARLGEWIALAVVNAASLYAYYYLGLLVLAENLAFAALLLGDSSGTSHVRKRLTHAIRVGRKGPVVERGLVLRGESPTPGPVGERAPRLRSPTGLPLLHERLGDGARTTFVAGWLGVQAATVLLYLPWLAALWGLFASGAAMAVPPETAVHRSLASYLRECLLAFSIGFARPAPWADLIGGLTLALAALSLTFRPKSRPGWWLLVFGIAVSMAGAYAVTLRRPFFYPRFIVYGAPLLYVLVGAGLARLLAIAPATSVASLGISPARRLAPLLAAGALACLLAGNAQSLAAHYTRLRTTYSSADYRVILGTLAEQAQPGDAVVGTYPWQVGYVAGYLPDARLALLYKARAPGAARQTEAAHLLGQYPRVWLLLYSADGRWAEDPLEQALAVAGAPSFVDQFGDSRIRLFAAIPPEPAPSPAARLGDRVALLQYSLSPAGDRRPGESVDLTLVWQALASIGDSYTVFTHLLGPDGRVCSQVDSPPLGGARATTTWKAGEVIVDRYRLAIAADVPAGEYLAEAGLYLPSTGQRLPVGRSPAEADRIILGRFRVVR